MKTTKWIGLAGVTIASLLVSGVAFAATYNFYFNNTEQGDNSTATPNVTVEQDDKGGPAKVTKTGGDPMPAASAVPAVMEQRVMVPVQAPAQPVESEPRAMVQTTKRYLLAEDGGFKHFSMGLGVGVLDRKNAVGGSYQYNDPNDPFSGYSVSSGSESSATGGLMLTMGYDFTRDIGVRAFAIAYSDSTEYTSDDKTDWAEGADLELTPIHVKIGHRENLIDLGGMVGGTNYKASSDADAEWKVFGGPRMNVNITDAIQVTASYRFSELYNMFELGAAIRI
jgi:hypothetical protein